MMLAFSAVYVELMMHRLGETAAVLAQRRCCCGGCGRSRLKESGSIVEHVVRQDQVLPRYAIGDGWNNRLKGVKSMDAHLMKL